MVVQLFVQNLPDANAGQVLVCYTTLTIAERFTNRHFLPKGD